MRRTKIGVLCDNHYHLYHKYGYIPERTKKDKNDVISIDSEFSEIILRDNSGKEISRTIVDSEDLERVCLKKWHLSNSGYVVSTQESSCVRMHNVIMNTPNGFVVDHINGNRLDNRKCNLRICKCAENSRNKSVISRNNISNCIGVRYSKHSKKWHSYIGINKKIINLGYYDLLDDAINARIKAEDLYYGEFAPSYNNKFRVNLVRNERADPL